MSSVIANQHWDEGVPFRIDGKDGFGSYYRGLSSTSDGQMQVYNEEDPFIDAANPGKLGMLLNGLDEADRQFVEAIAIDEHQPDRMYAGTREGQLFASRDGGDSWTQLDVSLPRITTLVCVHP